MLAALQQVLPEGSVRDETTFLLLIVGLAALIGAAIYLRLRRKREEEKPG